MDLVDLFPYPSTNRGGIAAPQDTVWQVISEVEHWPEWNSDVSSMVVNGRIQPGTEFRWKSGRVSLVSSLQVVDPPKEIAWTGESMGIHAVHVFHLESGDGRTTVRSEESFRGLMPSLLKSYSRTVLQRGIDSILAALKIEAERRASAQAG